MYSVNPSLRKVVVCLLKFRVRSCFRKILTMFSRYLTNVLYLADISFHCCCLRAASRARRRHTAPELDAFSAADHMYDQELNCIISVPVRCNELVCHCLISPGTSLCRLCGRLGDLISEPTRTVGATVTEGTVILIGLPRMAR